MSKITKEQYELALARIEELLPMVDENTPLTDRNAVELSLMSGFVIEYEKELYPIEKGNKTCLHRNEKSKPQCSRLAFFVENSSEKSHLTEKSWQNDYITRLIPLYNSFFSVFLPLIFCLY